jgi:hypothetical protein
MKGRCSNPNDNSFKDYGALGIEVCEYYRLDFFNFLIDVGLAPSAAHTIDRIDSKKNYEPGNLRWVTRDIQNLNKKNVHTAIAKLKLRLLLDRA